MVEDGNVEVTLISERYEFTCRTRGSIPASFCHPDLAWLLQCDLYQMHRSVVCTLLKIRSLAQRRSRMLYTCELMRSSVSLRLRFKRKWAE
jgi:hypothetical protein